MLLNISVTSAGVLHRRMRAYEHKSRVTEDLDGGDSRIF